MAPWGYIIPRSFLLSALILLGHEVKFSQIPTNIEILDNQKVSDQKKKSFCFFPVCFIGKNKVTGHINITFIIQQFVKKTKQTNKGVICYQAEDEWKDEKTKVVITCFFTLKHKTKTNKCAITLPYRMLPLLKTLLSHIPNMSCSCCIQKREHSNLIYLSMFFTLPTEF